MRNTSTMPHFDAVVLGAGASGMASASILLNRGVKSVLLLDKYDHLGGNHISVEIGPYSFDIGSFFFQDESPFTQHFPEPGWVEHDPREIWDSQLRAARGVLEKAGANAADIAAIAASRTCRGVSKSGSPALSAMISRPWALRSRARWLIATVGDG